MQQNLIDAARAVVAADRAGELTDEHILALETAANAEVAQAIRHHKPVATVRVTHKGYGMKLSTYVAYALPEGMHDVYAVPQPAAVPDEARECLLDVVSHHHDFAEAVQRCADIERENGDDEDVGYWKHQADVLNRMKEQAERALAAAPAQVEQQAPAAPSNGRGAMFVEFVSALAAKAGHKELAADLLAAIRAAGETGFQGLPALAEPACHIAEVSDEGGAIACSPAQHQKLREGMQLYAAPVAMPDTQAAMDVLAERKRQVEVEGWTPEKDDQYHPHVLSGAAGCYAMHTLAYPAGDPPPGWPFAASWWKPSADTRRNRVKAAALLLAEIERIDRAAARQGAEAQEGGEA